MKKIKIYSILENSDNETTKIEALATYDDKKGILKYSEEDLNVEIELFKDKVIIKRKNDEYDINLEFELNKRIKCKYEVKQIGLNLEIEVLTKKLEIEENRIYINYELFNDNKSIGIFDYKLMILE